MSLSVLKQGTRVTPRPVTSDLIQEVNFPRLPVGVSLFDLGPTNKISVFSSFNFKTVLLIHLFIAKGQVTMEFNRKDYY